MANTDSVTLPKARPRPVFVISVLVNSANYRCRFRASPRSCTGSPASRCSSRCCSCRLLQMSLKSEAGLEAFRTIIWGNIVGKIVLIGLLFALIYHMVAGFRHLIQDATSG